MMQRNLVGKLPGWTLLVSLLGSASAPMVILAVRDFGMPWWIGVPAAIAVTICSVLLERAIERLYAVPRGRD